MHEDIGIWNKRMYHLYMDFRGFGENENGSEENKELRDVTVLIIVV